MIIYMPKIVYSVRPLKNGERRATMKEAVDAGQVRFWGFHKVDNILLNKKYGKQNEKLSIEQLRGRIFGLQGLIKKIKKEIDKTENDYDVEKLEKKIKKLDKDRKMYIEMYKELQ